MRADLLSLASGTAIAVLGILVLLDSSGALEVSLGWMAVAVTAALGAILALSGLAGGGRDRHD